MKRPRQFDADYYPFSIKQNMENFIDGIERYCDHIERELTESNNKTFLDTLVHYAKRYGWNGDYIEVVSFVDWCHDELGVERREMELGEQSCS